MSSTSAPELKPCTYCGAYHSAICPRIESIEYFPNGRVKRVVLRDPNNPWRGPQDVERFT